MSDTLNTASELAQYTATEGSDIADILQRVSDGLEGVQTEDLPEFEPGAVLITAREFEEYQLLLKAMDRTSGMLEDLLEMFATGDITTHSTKATVRFLSIHAAVVKGGRGVNTKGIVGPKV
jgi:hypothetical protein